MALARDAARVHAVFLAVLFVRLRKICSGSERELAQDGTGTMSGFAHWWLCRATSGRVSVLLRLCSPGTSWPRDGCSRPRASAPRAKPRPGSEHRERPGASGCWPCLASSWARARRLRSRRLPSRNTRSTSYPVAGPRRRCTAGPHVPDRRHGHAMLRRTDGHARGALRRHRPSPFRPGVTRVCCWISSARGRG